MPIGFDPNDTCEVTLRLDADQPEEKRMKFKVRFLSAGDTKKVYRLIQQAKDERDEVKADDMINEAMKVGIVGWSNIRRHDGSELPFTTESFDEFTWLQKYRICHEYPVATTLAEADKKKSA